MYLLSSENMYITYQFLLQFPSLDIMLFDFRGKDYSITHTQLRTYTQLPTYLYLILLTHTQLLIYSYLITYLYSINHT